MTARRLRVGLVGTGLIAQVMHLHHLGELADRFEVAAVCDIVGDSARACADRYRIPAVFTDWRELIRQPLDAVLALTSGSHAPVAVAAAQAGMHVFVEKPMCFSAGEGRAMVAAAGQAGVTLMVGYPKRYDPAYARFAEEAGRMTGGAGLVSLGRYHPAGDMARAEVFGTRGTARCDFLDPAEGERAQLEAVRLQAESFAAFAGGGPCEGATGADAIAALDAAERAAAAIRVGERAAQ